MSTPASPVKYAPPNITQRIGQAVSIKERIEELKAELKELEKQKEEVYGDIRVYLQTTGQQFTKTKVGDAGLFTKTSYSVADQDAYRNYVIGNEDWDLLVWGVRRTEAEAFYTKHAVYPPGVDVTTFQEVRITPPKASPARKTHKKVEVTVKEKFNAFGD